MKNSLSIRNIEHRSLTVKAIGRNKSTVADAFELSFTNKTMPNQSDQASSSSTFQYASLTNLDQLSIRTPCGA